MCWWPQKDAGSPTSQWAPEDEKLTVVTAAFPHSPVGREGFHEPDMEAVKTQYLPGVGDARAFEVQSANPRRTPSTPQKSRPNSSGKILELTPLWEQVLRYNRLPQNVEKVKVFAELAMRLSDPEWEVRQHALRVLVDLIPVIPEAHNDLDALMIPVVLTEVTYNLGHPAPAVRKSALDVLSTYIKHSSDPEFVLRSVVSQGLESPAANSNLTLSVLISIPPLLQDLQDTLVDHRQTISHQSLVQMVTALSKKLVQTLFQQKAINAMLKIRELVGETRFDHFLESYYPQIKRDFEVLCKVYEVRANNSNLGDSGIDIQPETNKSTDTNDNEDDDWSDNGVALHRSSNVTSSTSTTERTRFELSNEEFEKLKSNSKLYSRIDTDSNADSQEKKGDAVDEEDYAQSDSDVSMHGHKSSDSEEQDSENGSDVDSMKTKKQKEIDSVFGEMTIHGKENSADDLDASRVVMETEIKFDSETAITMTILEEKENRGKLKQENSEAFSIDESEDRGNRFMNDFVMHVVEEDEHGMKRTPRRVRFGGEVVKLRTPDSDVTIEIHEEVDGKETPILKFVDSKAEDAKESVKTPKKTKNKKVEDLSISGKESILYAREEKTARNRPRSSHIPLPIVPALSRPQLPWMKKSERTTEDEDSSIPNFDGGDSLTSGSEGDHPPPRSGFRSIRVAQEADEWQRLGFIDQVQLEHLIRKEDWRARVRALEKLAATLGRAEVARFVAVSSKVAGLSLLLFLLKTLHDDRSQRIACSSLRALRALIEALPAGDVVQELPSVVPGICRQLGGGTSVSVKLEAVGAMKSLLRAVRPGPVLQVLFTDKCFYSKSSRLRENALLCLMYALMTFPSTEFQVASLAQRIMSAAVLEPRRRVRQSILEALAALAQFVPASQMRLDEKDFPSMQQADVYFFTNALHTRLMRKVLPSVSPEGLILYGLHVTPNHEGYSSNQNRETTNENSAPSYSIEPTNSQGADVEWVMAGTGVLSSGSARSRTQLENAQRSFISPTDQHSNSTQSWDSDGMTVAGVSVNSSKESFSSDDSKASPDRLNGPRQPHQSYVSSRPLYLKIQNGQDAAFGNTYHQEYGFPKLNSTHISRHNYSEALNQTWPTSKGKLTSRRLAILEPLDQEYQQGLFQVYQHNETYPHPHVSINPSNLPPLDWRPQSRWAQQQQYDLQRTQNGQKTSKWARRPDEIERRLTPSERENGLRPVLARQSKYPSAATSLQTNGHVSPVPGARFVSPTPLAPLAPPSTAPQPLMQRQPQEAALLLPQQVPSSQSLRVEDLSGDNSSEAPRSRPPSQVGQVQPLNAGTDHVDALTVQEERLSTPPPAPPSPAPLPPPAAPDTEPETTQSEELTAEEKTPLSHKKFNNNTGKPRLRTNRGTSKEMNGVSSSSSPEVAPFDNAKDALNRCLQQLEHPEWEVTILGLQAVVRLCCHHTSQLTPVLHQVVIAVTKHVRNLRSQVARVASKAATHLFACIGRGMENVRDMEELCAALFNRTADTNKFLRADCNAALDAMVDNVGSTKIVASIVNKGAKHQNAVVRAAACRLLLRLCTRLGPEKVLSLPRETRDAILNTAARSLTEGSLDTRGYAKEMLILLSQDSRLGGLLTEVVPPSVLRSITKVLARLTAK